MNETQHLLTILAEECAEVAQRCSKAIRFGMTEVQPGQPDDNKRRIERELGDLMATAELLGLRVHDEDKVGKWEKLKKYMALSRAVDMLDPHCEFCLSSGWVYQWHGPDEKERIPCPKCKHQPDKGTVMGTPGETSPGAAPTKEVS